MKRRILFVDDEPSIRATLPSILQMHGFEVESAESVERALAIIQQKRFDVLISDLNIGQPGDGFTVVSAMRRLQPAAITMILTGYPAFETALKAIREQVDDYIAKPADVDSLVGVIEEKLKGKKPQHPIPLKRLAALVEENLPSIIHRWLQLVMSNAEIAAIPLRAAERTERLPALVKEIVQGLKAEKPGLAPSLLDSTAEHGRVRRRQGYTIPMIVEEARILRGVICVMAQENLLGVDISYVIPDLLCVNDQLDAALGESIRAYLELDLRPANVGKRAAPRKKRAA